MTEIIQVLYATLTDVLVKVAKISHTALNVQTAIPKRDSDAF